VRRSSKEPLQFGPSIPSASMSVKSSTVSSMAPRPYFLSKGLLTP